MELVIARSNSDWVVNGCKWVMFKPVSTRLGCDGVELGLVPIVCDGLELDLAFLLGGPARQKSHTHDHPTGASRLLYMHVARICVSFSQNPLGTF